jgi:hypothetical protein
MTTSLLPSLRPDGRPAHARSDKEKRGARSDVAGSQTGGGVRRWNSETFQSESTRVVLQGSPFQALDGMSVIPPWGPIAISVANGWGDDHNNGPVDGTSE